MLLNSIVIISQNGEIADVKKQAFVREEVEREAVRASETIRREELEVDADGDVIEK